MKNAELVFMPAPVIGHLVPMVEMAKLFVSRYERLSVTVLIPKFAFDIGASNYTQSLVRNLIPRLKIVELPETDPDTYMSNPRHFILIALFETQKSNVREIVSNMTRSDLTRLAGFVLDFICINMIDIANEFQVPSYVFNAAGAGFLGVASHLLTLTDDYKQDITELRNSDAELVAPSFANPVPASVLPLFFLDKEHGTDLLKLLKRYRETKGIIVNTFEELESYAINSLQSDSMNPSIYPVGPILNLNGEGQNSDEAAVILGWLDDQPPSSVVFLCFGSYGCFQEDQAKEIALALERSRHRFLWSLRKPNPESQTNYPIKYKNLEQVLPAGFLERTTGVGKVIEWAPQVAVLSHVAVGGFISHCGWNSTLESMWFGVPMATWPIYAEQQLNAFEMVTELGLAMEIKVDYHNEFNMSNEIVTAEKIETKIRKLMMDDKTSEIRKKAKEMKEKSRAAVSEKGSSYTSLAKLIEEIM